MIYEQFFKAHYILEKQLKKKLSFDREELLYRSKENFRDFIKTKGETIKFISEDKILKSVIEQCQLDDHKEIEDYITLVFSKSGKNLIEKLFFTRVNETSSLQSLVDSTIIEEIRSQYKDYICESLIEEFEQEKPEKKKPVKTRKRTKSKKPEPELDISFEYEKKEESENIPAINIFDEETTSKIKIETIVKTKYMQEKMMEQEKESDTNSSTNKISENSSLFSINVRNDSSSVSEKKKTKLALKLQENTTFVHKPSFLRNDFFEQQVYSFKSFTEKLDMDFYQFTNHTDFNISRFRAIKEKIISSVSELLKKYGRNDIVYGSYVYKLQIEPSDLDIFGRFSTTDSSFDRFVEDFKKLAGVKETKLILNASVPVLKAVSV